MDYLDDNIITITAQESAERIDALLARCVPELTRSAAARLIEDGAVTVGGRAVRKNYKCAPGDEISLIMPEAADCELRPQDIPSTSCTRTTICWSSTRRAAWSSTLPPATRTARS